MQYRLKQFIGDQSGAVTVDWVVLTAAVIGLGGAAMNSVGTGTTSLTQCTENSLAAITVSSGSRAGQMTGANFAAQAVADNPDSKIAAIKAVRAALQSSAPSGYSFAGYIDIATDTPLYVSSSDSSYLVNGEQISRADYNASGNGTTSAGLKYAKTKVEEEIANPSSATPANGAFTVSSAAYENGAACPDMSDILNRPIENMTTAELAEKSVILNPDKKINAIKQFRKFLAEAAPTGYTFASGLIDVESGYPI